MNVSFYWTTKSSPEGAIGPSLGFGLPLSKPRSASHFFLEEKKSHFSQILARIFCRFKRTTSPIRSMVHCIPFYHWIITYVSTNNGQISMFPSIGQQKEFIWGGYWDSVRLRPTTQASVAWVWIPLLPNSLVWGFHRSGVESIRRA